MSTANAPNCGFPLAEGATGCPACGIVVAKYLAPPPPSPSSPAAATNEDGSPASLHESPKDLRLTFSTLAALTAPPGWCPGFRGRESSCSGEGGPRGGPRSLGFI